jgi:hypothetical protein
MSSQGYKASVPPPIYGLQAMSPLTGQGMTRGLDVLPLEGFVS